MKFRFSFVSGAMAAGLLFSHSHALAGPPFVTDDPEPADYQHFEINTAMQGTYTKDGRAGAWPNLDINYGLIPDVQFTVNLFGAYAKGYGEKLHYGDGDTEVALKYRFLEEDEDGWVPMAAFYPNITFATGKAPDNLGSGHDRVFLPLWLQKNIGDFQTYGGGGYYLNRYGDTDRDYWFFGWAALYKLSEQWQLGGEIFKQTADLTAKGAALTVGDGVSDKKSSGFNLGGYCNLNEEDHIIFAFGRGLQNRTETNSFSYYVGYQVIY